MQTWPFTIPNDHKEPFYCKSTLIIIRISDKLLLGGQFYKHSILPTKKKTYGYLDNGRGLVRVTVINLEYTRPRGQARVYRSDIHRKSLRPEEYIWNL